METLRSGGTARSRAESARRRHRLRQTCAEPGCTSCFLEFVIPSLSRDHFPPPKPSFRSTFRQNRALTDFPRLPGRLPMICHSELVEESISLRPGSISPMLGIIFPHARAIFPSEKLSSPSRTRLREDNRHYQLVTAITPQRYVGVRSRLSRISYFGMPT